jgi:acyl-CoA synthetase (AMP-forming)/AMP-acid ligase II
VTRPFTLADVFEVMADAGPHRLALVAGDVRRTYSELDARANRVGHALRESGLEVGAHVAILSWNRAEWVESMLGCYKARLVPINVNYRYVADELRHVLADSDAQALVVERGFLPQLAQIRVDLPLLRTLFVMEDGSDAPLPSDAVGYEPALSAASPDGNFGERSPDDRYILYTGGTTGLPKGVVWRQEDIFFGAIGAGNPYAPPISAPEELAANAEKDPLVQLILPPMMHGGGQWMFFITTCLGGTVVLWTGRHLDPAAVLGLIERERAHMLMVVGDAMARPIIDALAADPSAYDVSSLFVIGSGGAILSPAVKNAIRELLPGVMVTDSFGASETGANGSVHDHDGPAAGPRFTLAPHTKVVDDNFEPVAPGVVGRLARSGHIPLGYYNDDAKTAATFVTDAGGTRWVVPGDFARVETDGTTTLLGRGSVVINTGGEKVFPEEVEAVLKAHPDVFDVVVVGVPDERYGESVAAVVAARDDAQPVLDELAAHTRKSLAGYKVPRHLILVDHVVRTPVGKPDYRWAKATAVHQTTAGLAAGAS